MLHGVVVVAPCLVGFGAPVVALLSILGQSLAPVCTSNISLYNSSMVEGSGAAVNVCVALDGVQTRVALAKRMLAGPPLRLEPVVRPVRELRVHKDLRFRNADENPFGRTPEEC